jgi:hypothetical protein
MKFPLCRITVNSIKVDLELDLDLDAERIEAVVILPDNYPDTVMGEKYKNREIFILSFSVRRKDHIQEQLNKYIGPLGDLLDVIDTHYIFIHEFYLYPKSSNTEMTREEQLAFGGIGKKVLCIVFNLLMDKFPLRRERVLVVLEASGNIRDLVGTEAREREIKKLDKYALVDLIERYELLKMSNVVNMVKPKELKYLFTDNSQKWKELDKKLILKYFLYFIMNYDENITLANYYTRNYGFQIVDKTNFSHILMATTASNILNNCSSKLFCDR